LLPEISIILEFFEMTGMIAWKHLLLAHIHQQLRAIGGERDPAGRIEWGEGTASALWASQ
jgi:hypothetical protein